VENIVRENEKLRILNENLKTEIHENLNIHESLQENINILTKKADLLEINNEDNRKEMISLKDEKGDN
jgi:cell division septum initiation protein DivIVA